MAVVNKIYKYAEPNLTIVGWMGFIGFPTYYYVWAYLFPQPYENLTFRLICSLSLLALALRNFFPHYLKKYLPHYYLWCIGLCLPFFFSFMLMMNDWSSVWVMSFMASIFLHILLVHETKVLVTQCVVSIGFAFVLSYLITGEVEIHEIDWSYVPVFGFTYLFGNLFYFRNQLEHEARISLAKSFGAGIAHEMRNPLSALKTTVDLLKATLVGKEPNSPLISSHDRKEMSDLLDDANSIIQNGNEAIDLLLTSIDQNRVSRSTFLKHSVDTVLEDAISSYPYQSFDAQKAVTVDVKGSFDYFGSDTLLKYALYNLFKNAFYYQSESQFNLHIEVIAGETTNILRVKDNGLGIEESKVEAIFNDFYTFGKNGSYGLGLPFCRRVMRSFGGDIECRSVVGEWTEFTLLFPKYRSSTVQDIKFDLIRSKTILSIGTEFSINRSFNEQSFYLGYRLNYVSIEKALKLEEYQFEYDLIFIDLDSISEMDLNALETNLCFTEAKIIYLYDPSIEYHTNFNRFLQLSAISKLEMVNSFNDTLDRLIFVNEVEDRNRVPKKTTSFDRTVLLVDDNDSVRSLTSILLSQQGFQVIEAKDGNDVLKLVETEEVDVVIMDIEMPLLNGFEATKLLRSSLSEKANIPVIGHTGDNSSECIEQMKLVGMNDYIIKPATNDVLVSKLEHYI
ncbi:hybrid sensor histidine kinase/response regulator [Vibrio sp. ZSDE26]|uniref:histidine kinase n=1 Tax=Vibrio amylolyticus TaxID=2847292 RepID=A0A9X1XK53_9VIBR|nr:hybrid sensor histidine kinase/response regulator [Vibrio amylolyticus]MCK6263921.1 hybrid sensor histidine kinase/response regulator [Vibrio amylolyticus]